MDNKKELIDKLRLLYGDLINVDGISFKQPKLKDIKNLGMNMYYAYISILVMSAEQYLMSIGQKHLIPSFKHHNLTMFDIYTDNPQERQMLIQALSFFIDGKIVYGNDKNFIINNKYIINKNNYLDIVNIIGQINHFKANNIEETYANEKARQIAERIQKAKEKRANLKTDFSLLDSIISAVASKHSSYNLFNIWDLSVYQLYDQYQRLFLIDNFNISAMNYAYWGGDLKTDWSKPLE